MRLASATISSSPLFSKLAELFGHESEPRPTAVAMGMPGIRAPSPRAAEEAGPQPLMQLGAVAQTGRSAAYFVLEP
jgi:hypothetical protein